MSLVLTLKVHPSHMLPPCFTFGTNKWVFSKTKTQWKQLLGNTNYDEGCYNGRLDQKQWVKKDFQGCCAWVTWKRTA